MKKQIYSSLLIVAALMGNLSAQTTFTISTFGGTGVASSTGDGGNVSLATFNAPHGVTTDALGNIFVSEFGGQKIRKINSSGIVSLYGGTGVGGFSGDGGLATAAQFNAPTGIALDASGNLYIAEYIGNRVRKIATSGTVTTIAGTGAAASSGDGGPATAAQLNAPTDVKIDPAGNIYIAEGSGNRVRKISTTGIITTIVGNGTATSTGDGGLASAATTNFPVSLYFDAAGNMYVCELTGNRVRKVNTSGVISTIIGTGVASSTGDGGLATAATLNQAGCMLIDAGGNMLVSEYSGARIRSVNSASIISTAVGTGVGGFSGDGGLATAAQISGPFQLAQAIAPNQIYVAEYLNNRIRLLTSSSCTTAVTATVAGSPAKCFGTAGASATVTPVGGSGFTYTWSPIGGNAAVASSLTAGPYTVTVKNSCGSVFITTITVGQAPAMITTIFGNPMSVCSGGSSTLTTIATGGTPSYTYSWAPTGGSTNTTVVTSTATTIYTATATDANSCTKTSTIQITVNTPTVTAVTSASVLCAGQTATLTASGANTYTWNTASTNTSIAVSPSVTTSYTVVGTNGSGCFNGTIITQSVSTCIGISEQVSGNYGLTLYPNPNNGEFTIVSGNVSSDMHFEVYNAIGQLILKDVIFETETKVALKNANSGIYFVKLMNGTQVMKVQKMVKE